MKTPVRFGVVLIVMTCGVGTLRAQEPGVKNIEPLEPIEAAPPSEEPEAKQKELLRGTIRMHDPSGIVDDNGYLMTFHTGRQIGTMFLAPGSDAWQKGQGVFPRDARPAWIQDHVPRHKGFWAPHMPSPRVLYYSVADDRDEKDIGAIGRATATGEPPNLTWVDDGRPVIVCDRSERNEPFTIDPAVFTGDEGSLWMVYGSHWSGIWIVELDPAIGHVKDPRGREEGWKIDNRAFYRVASARDNGSLDVLHEDFWAGQIEAPYVFRGSDYYYLFVNWGKCCSGVESTYEIRVGRSKQPQGPYLDKQGKDLAHAGGTLFLEKDGRFIGPGHANIFTTTDTTGTAQNVFTYHFYDGKAEGRPKMNARYLTLGDDGWPVLTDKVFFQKE